MTPHDQACECEECQEALEQEFKDWWADLDQNEEFIAEQVG